MKTFKLEIITPERVAYTEEVDEVVAPAVNGEVGILAQHVPYFTQLNEGEVKIIKGMEEYFLAIGGGFLEVTPQKTTLLVTKAVHADEINEEEVKKALENAQKAMKEKPEGKLLSDAQAIMRSSLVDLKILNKLRSRKSSPKITPR